MKKLILIISMLVICKAGQAQLVTTQSAVTERELKEKHFEKRSISRELIASSAPHVLINNSFKSYEIKTWDQNKVKIVASFKFDSNEKFDDEQIWSKLNISLSGNSETIKINARPETAVTIRATGSVKTLKGIGGNPKGVVDGERNLTIYVPLNSTIDIDEEFSNCLIQENIKNLHAKIFNCQFQTQDINNLKLNSTLSNLNAGKINSADITFKQGIFTSGDIDGATINSESSIFNLQNIKEVNFNSNNDNYEMENAIQLSGTKKLGEIRIEQLSKSMKIESESADIRIHRISTSVDFISIKNSLGYLTLPLATLPDYKLDFKGEKSILYAPFKIQNKNSASDAGGSQSLNFSHIEGKLTNPRSNFSVICNNCTVDFK